MRVALPPWLQDLRRTEVVDRVWSHPGSSAGAPLGVPEDAMQDAIGWGQADFDQPYGDLSAADRVLLYALLNQLGHLEELTAVFRHLFQTKRPDSPIVVDVGCGPCTGGLALAAVLGPGSDFDYVGVDQAEAMRRFGDRLADAARTCDDTPQFRAVWAADLASIPWSDLPRWRSVIVIVSYLFASPTLEVGTLVNQFDGLFQTLGCGEVTVLYTNSAKPRPNRPLDEFRTKLKIAGFQSRYDGKVAIEVERGAEWKTRSFHCALWHRLPMVHYRPRPT